MAARKELSGLEVLGTLTLDGDNVWHEGNLTPSDFAYLTGATFTGAIAVNAPGSFQIDFHTTNTSSHDVGISVGGARTGSSSDDIGYLDFRNNTSSAYDLARIAARDPSADHTLGHGRLVFQVANGAGLADQGYIDRDGSVVFYGGITSQGGTVWTANNDGSGSGLDADLLDGNHASAFAQLTGATFTGTIDAPTVRVSGTDVWTADNDGSGSGLNADLLDGDHGSAFAKLTGATFTGGVTATGFTGDGGGLTGVDADTLGGTAASGYALVAGDTFTGDVTFAGETIHTGRRSWIGSTSEMLLGVQDGNGRIQMKWNASNGTGETRLVGGEDAFFWDVTVVSDVWRMLWSDGTGTATNDPISWDVLLTLSQTGVLNASGDVTVNGNSVWTTADFDIADYAVSADVAFLSGATFTGGITAPSFSGDGTNVTNVTAVNSTNLGGQAASAYALLSGATFTGTVTAANFVGDGASITDLNASELTTGTVPTARLPAVTVLADQCSNATGNFTMQVNDGGGNIGLRWNATPGGTSNLVEAGHAWELQIDNDSSTGDLTWYRGSSATGAAGESITWDAWFRFDGGNGDIDLLKPLDLNGNAINSPGALAVGSGDFTVTQTGGGVTNVIWWDVSAEALYLGTLLTSGNGIVEMRAPLVNTSHDTRLAGLGVGGATPDATNAFAFYGTDLLLNSGGSINLKFNKNASGNDASLTFQSGFTTYGLVGLLANNDLTFKVGTGFTTALVLSNSDGTVNIPEGVRNDTVTAYKTSSQTLTGTGTWDDVTSWDGTHVAASGNLSWTASTGQAFVGKAGRFLVSYSLSTEISTGSSRTDSLAKLQKWNGSAWVDVEGTEHRMYNRISGRGGTNAGWTGVLDLDASDGLKVVATVETGTDTVIVDQVALSITRM